AGRVRERAAGGKLLQGNDAGILRDRRELGPKLQEVFMGAIVDPERGAALLQAFDGRAAGRAAGPEQNDIRTGQAAAESFAHCGGEAVAVGVGAAPAVRVPDERVDRADRPRGRADLGDKIEGQDLVRHGEVEAGKFFVVKEWQCAWQVVRWDVETKIAPVAEARVARGQGG